MLCITLPFLRYLLAGLALCIITPLLAQTTTEPHIIAQNAYWHILVHADKNKPMLPDQRFYLAPLKHWSPEKELTATLAAFRNIHTLDNTHAICRYPARFHWLLAQLKQTTTDFPQPICAALNDYYRETSVHQVTVNFASEDVNKVTTMLGHIYFDLIGKTHTTVSHSISYITPIAGKAAPTLLYEAFLGGEGFLALEPSSHTLYDYLYTQQRNVWQYPLNLSPRAIRRLVNHAWELRNINAGYRFIDHNCGTIFFNLLAAAKPEIIHYDKKPWITPLEYLQLLNEHHLLNIQQAQVHLAPRYALRTLHDSLSQSSLIQANMLYQAPTSPTYNLTLPLYQQAPVIHLAEQRLLNESIKGNVPSAYFKAKQHQLNQMRQTLPLGYRRNANFLDYKNPLKATKGSRIQLAIQQTEFRHQPTRTQQLIGFLPESSLITDNHNEYFGDYALTLGHVVLRYEAEQNTLDLHTLNLYSFQSLLPSYKFDQSSLLSASIGAQPIYDEYLNSKLGFNVQGGIGYAAHALSSNIVLFGFGHAGYYYADGLAASNQHQLYLQPQLGLSIKQVFNMKLFIDTRYTITQSNTLRYWHAKVSQSLYLSLDHTLLLQYEYLKNDLNSANRIRVEWRYNF